MMKFFFTGRKQELLFFNKIMNSLEICRKIHSSYWKQKNLKSKILTKSKDLFLIWKEFCVSWKIKTLKVNSFLKNLTK